MNDQAMNDQAGSTSSVDRLNTRLDDLERRIEALDQRLDEYAAALGRAGTAAGAEVATNSAAGSPMLPEVPTFQAGGIFPVLGRAMLGIAGAYLLRALAESRIVPELALAPFAIAYAVLWLVAGARTCSAFAAAIYACTSALILAPMLWELTMTFKALPAWASAITLALYAGAAFALTRRADRAVALRIANLTTAALCLTLAIVTHDALPFLGVLLFIAALGEVAQMRQQVMAARGLVALAADAAVWMLIFLYRSLESTRGDYPALSVGWLIAPGFALFALYAASVALQSGLRRKSITVFETAQATIAFLLASAGLMYFGPAGREMALGALCGALAAALYAMDLAKPLREDGGIARGGVAFGAVVFRVWAAALVLAGIWLAVPAGAQTVCLAAAALLAVVAGAWLHRVPLAWHGTAFLLACAWTSGLLAYAFHALAGTPAATPGLDVCLAAACATLCYAIMQVRPDRLAHEAVFRSLFASLAALAAVALLVQGCARLAATEFAMGPHHLALIRSVILCAAALALAFSGARWQRPELTGIGYAVVVLEAVKLLAEDLRHGHLAYVAGSVCVFAFTLIAIPRVARSAPRRRRAA